MTEPFDAIEATRELLAEVRTAHIDLRRRLTVAQARIAELEATLAGVRKLPASWRAFTGMDRGDCIADLEDTLTPPSASASRT